ncbi:MAG: helix-turn-helix domain-containing protein [Bacteroidales bacterium]|jgi:AraC-like DNA-binding protein/mannose-6-phosphate isomerase-like protein (cupin superfamily)|nr:helix-turn-helix domain-containing protein [Bacteroidales bacterium]MBP5214824.1 helix-turn-helix domain-containing protein [Bacteroidales bacterium]MBP5763562.1 helix-turn-helix domain-containing protein [Bacteroidales bacterium]
MRKEDNFVVYDLSSKAKQPGEELFRLRQMPEVFHEEGFRSVHLHTHSFYTIIWFQKGEGKHFVDFDEYEVRENSIFFISPDQLHTFDSNHEQHGYVLEFSQEFLQDEHSSESLFLKYDVFNAYDTLPYRLIGAEGAQTLQRIVDELNREEHRHESFAHHDYLSMLVRLFLITVQRSHIHNEEYRQLSITSPLHRHFVRFRQQLEMNYQQIHSVSEYARMIGISTKTLTSCCLECSGQTPLQLINARLTLEAKRLLRFTHLSSKEVGYHLGFEDPSYFVKVFKNKTGLLPLEFREKGTLS